MARKYSRSRRFAPSTERALYKEQQLSGRHIDRTDLMDAIRGGEDSYLEFKVRFSNPEKLAAGICALANSGGGTIVFGVTDQLRLEGISHPELIEQDLLAICRERLVPPVWSRIDKVAFDSGLRILVFEVDSRRAPHRTVDGRYFIRVGAAKREATGEEIAELYRGRTGARAFEDTPLLHADPTTDIDEAAIWAYLKEITAGHADVSPDYRMGALLADLRLAVRYGEDLVPTVGGILLFGKGTAVAKRLPQSPLVVRRVSGSDTSDQVVEEVEFIGNLGNLYERAVQFVERYADLWESRPRRRPTAPVAARPYFPRIAVLEALANALVHRDYASQSGDARNTFRRSAGDRKSFAGERDDATSAAIRCARADEPANQGDLHQSGVRIGRRDGRRSDDALHDARVHEARDGAYRDRRGSVQSGDPGDLIVVPLRIFLSRLVDLPQHVEQEARVVWNVELVRGGSIHRHDFEAP